MEFYVIFVGAALVNNIILTQFLGICPFLGVSKKADSAISMGAAVIFVTFLSSIMGYLLYKFVLVPYEIEYIQTIAYVLLIASLVQFMEMVMKKFSPAIYKALGIFLPLIATNCAILGTVNAIVIKEYDLLQSMVYSLGISIGFMLVMFLFSAIRERLDVAPTPRGFKGNPIALITAAIMALAFFGLGGLV